MSNQWSVWKVDRIRKQNRGGRGAGESMRCGTWREHEREHEERGQVWWRSGATDRKDCEKTLVDEQMWRQADSESRNNFHQRSRVFGSNGETFEKSYPAQLEARVAHSSHLVVSLASRSHSARLGGTCQTAVKQTSRRRPAVRASTDVTGEDGGLVYSRRQPAAASWKTRTAPFLPWVCGVCFFFFCAMREAAMIVWGYNAHKQRIRPATIHWLKGSLFILFYLISFRFIPFYFISFHLFLFSFI